MTSRSFPFLELPPEIREKVYLLICKSCNIISLTSTTADNGSISENVSSSENSNGDTNDETPSFHPLFPLSLLLTCQQLYDEVRPLYFQHNSFYIHLTRNHWPLAYFINPSFSDNRRQIRSLRLIISRWGKYDFFLSKLDPVLEDMILIGRLRELEVWFKRSALHMFRIGSYQVGTGGSLGTRVTELALRMSRILEDVYLEKVTIRAGDEPKWGLGVEKLGEDDLEDVTHLFQRSRFMVKPEQSFKA